eukprot:660255-Amphidinium_carterae.1
MRMESNRNALTIQLYSYDTYSKHKRTTGTVSRRIGRMCVDSFAKFIPESQLLKKPVDEAT